MKAKLLLPAYGKHGAAVIGVNGKLRLVEPPKRICHGYRNCCVCSACKRRAEHARPRPVTRCACERPMGFADENCFHCGKPLPIERSVA